MFYNILLRQKKLIALTYFNPIAAVPMAKLQDPHLRDAMVEKRTKQLISEVIGAKDCYYMS